MKYRKATLAIIVTTSMVLAACGGDSEDSADSAGGAATDFAAPSITSEEVCAALPIADLQALFDFATFFDGVPPFEDERVLCALTASNDDASQVTNVSVIVENEGGQAGFDAYVDDWSTRGEVADVAGVGDAAASIENQSIRQVVVLDGQRVLVVNGPANASFGFTLEIATTIADIAAGAL